MKVSFDFDSTLDRPSIQNYAKELVDRGLEVWVVTSRLSNKTAPSLNWNNDLYHVIKDVGIPSNRVIFTEGADKSIFLKNKGFIWHIDDDWVTLKEIEDGSDVKAISCFCNNTWKEECEKLLLKEGNP